MRRGRCRARTLARRWKSALIASGPSDDRRPALAASDEARVGSSHPRLIGGGDGIMVVVRQLTVAPAPASPARIDGRQPLVARVEGPADVVDKLHPGLEQALDFGPDGGLLVPRVGHERV